MLAQAPSAARTCKASPSVPSLFAALQVTSLLTTFHALLTPILNPAHAVEALSIDF